MEISGGLLSIARRKWRTVCSAVLASSLMAGLALARDPLPAEHADRTSPLRSQHPHRLATGLDLLGFSQGAGPGSASLRLARYEIFRIPPIHRSWRPSAAKSTAATQSHSARPATSQRPQPADAAIQLAECPPPAKLTANTPVNNSTLPEPAPETLSSTRAASPAERSVNPPTSAAPEPTALAHDAAPHGTPTLAPHAPEADCQAPKPTAEPGPDGLARLALLPPACPVLNPPAPVPASEASPTSDPALPVPASEASPTSDPALPVLTAEAGWPVGVPVPRLAPAVADRARQLINEGIHLAERGALYSARARFVMALRLMTQALDTQTQSQQFSRALADGFRALDEAQDFQPRGSRLEAQLDLAQIVSTHRTTILQAIDLSQCTAMAARQRYHSYAEAQLSRAGGHELAAADALYGLARLQPFLNAGSDQQQPTSGPIAMSLYQAALTIHPEHYLAANELGTLLANFGQWQDARDVLRHAATVRPDCPIVWQNLAHVHEQLGERELAALAQHEWQVALQFSPPPAASNPRPAVQWVNSETFAALGHDDNSLAPTLPMAAPSQSAPARADEAAGTLSDRRQGATRPSAQDRPRPGGQRRPL